MADPRPFWNPIPLSELQAPREGVEWVWEGVLARRRITLLSAQAKAGKTTLVSLLIREMLAGGHLLGCPVSRGRVIVVSEESSQDWLIRRDRLELGDNAEVICVPFITKPSAADWLTLLRQGYLDIQERPVALVVFDTLSHLWPVQEENSNSDQQLALMPMRGLSELGPAVLLIHHAGAAGLRSRGATELEGFADQLAHLELTNPADPACRDRRFTVRGRLTSSPERLSISLTADGEEYQVLNGNLKPIRSGIWQTLAGLLPGRPPGFTIRELRGAWPQGEPVPGEEAVYTTLTRCGGKAGVCRGEEKPARWWYPANESAFPN